MSCSVVIVGLPSATTCPPEKTWSAAAGFVAQRLHARFGPDIEVTYVDLFSAEMADHPGVETLVAEGHLPPLVLVDRALALSGGKLNVTAIERAVAVALASTPRGEVATHA